MTAIATEQLAKHFSEEIRAVDGIDLDIDEGQVFGFLCQNGSGKSTTVRMLTTLLKPTSGKAVVGGIDVLANPSRIRRMVGVALQEVGLDELQTGRELLELQANLFGVRGSTARKRAADLLEVVTLTDAADRAIKGYSGGMKRRLDLACALVHEPSIIFLDEPTTGLDPITRDSVWRYIEELNSHGVTFFLTTQYLEEADRLADEVAIMDAGKIVAQGSPGELKATVADDAITLRFPNGQADYARAEPILRGFEGINEVRSVNDDVVVYIKNGAAAIAPLVRVLDDAGLSAAELRLTPPTLDDVFLRATGHYLDVGGTSQAPAAREKR